jgi:hypothetical protein
MEYRRLRSSGPLSVVVWPSRPNGKPNSDELAYFNGHMDPQTFLDWLEDLDYFFYWYDMSNYRRVRFAKWKLEGQAKSFWADLERRIDRVGRAPISQWDEMKERLKEKYLPISYRQKPLAQKRVAPPSRPNTEPIWSPPCKVVQPIIKEISTYEQMECLTHYISLEAR